MAMVRCETDAVLRFVLQGFQRCHIEICFVIVTLQAWPQGWAWPVSRAGRAGVECLPDFLEMTPR